MAESSGGMEDVLSVDDLFELMSELEPAKEQWYNLGLGLKVEQSELHSIQMDLKSPMDSLREMLEIWLDQIETRPSWKQVIDVLRNPVIENQDSLADDLEKKFLDAQTDKAVVTATEKPGNVELSNSDLYDVSNYLAALTESEVFVLSQALGLDGQTVSSFRNSPFFLDEVLMRWLQGKDEVMERGGHTWTALVKALREPVVDQHSIADKIEKETQSGHDSPEHP